MANLNENASELLTRYLDGELDPAQEAEVHAMLADDPSLGEEMSEQLAIRDSIKNDAEAYTPPPGSDSKIYSRLGFGSAAAGLGFLALVQKIAAPFAAAVVGSVLTYFLIQSFSGTDDFVKPADNSDVPVVSSTSGEFESAASGSGDGLNEIRTTKQAGREFTAAAAPVSEENFSDKVEVADKIEKKQSPELVTADYRAINPVDFNRHSGFVSDVSLNLDGPPALAYSPIFRTNAHGKFTAQVRGIFGYSFPHSAEPMQDGAVLPNFSIAVFRDVTENFQIGAEFGNETFSQVYQMQNGDAIVVVDQNPALMWGTVNFRASANDDFSALGGWIPFAQASAGACRIGPLAKGCVGLERTFSSGIGLMCGFEYAGLWYSYESQNYFTQKPGFTAGAIYKF